MKNSSHRFESLDALRGIAALFIALVHFPPIFLGADFAPLRHSYVLTNLFFALSGFIVMSAYGDKLTSWAQYADFSKHRLYRLAPLHVVTSVAILAVPYVAYGSNLLLTWLLTGRYAGDMPDVPVDWHAYMLHVLMLQGFGLLDHLVFNFPAWSMGAIFFCTLTLGLIVTLAPRWRAALFTLIAAVAFYVVAAYSPTYMGATYDYGIFRALNSYFMGTLTFLFWRRVQLHELAKHWAVLWQSLALVGVFWYATWVGVDSAKSLGLPLLFAGLMWAFAFDQGDYARFLRHRWCKWLSERSYSLFMNQSMFLFLGHQTLDWTHALQLNTWDARVWGTLAAAAYLGILLVVSNWTYKNIELRFAPRKNAHAAAGKAGGSRQTALGAPASTSAI